MKKNIVLLIFPAVVFIACNNTGKDSVEKADSVNEANLDTGLNRNAIVVDEESSSFLVRVADAGLAETEMAAWAQQNAVSQPVREFAAMLYKEHAALNDTVRILAAQKNIILPAVLSDDKQKEVSVLQIKTGKSLDREFIKIMITRHEESIRQFEKAMLDAKDPDIRSFADKTLPALRTHLESARSVQKNL